MTINAQSVPKRKIPSIFKHKIATLEFLYRIGGLYLIILFVWDRIVNKDCNPTVFQKYMVRRDPKEYPRCVKAYYKYFTGDELRLNNPRSYNEKIQWLKVFDTSSLKTELSDKYRARNWVSKKIGSQYLIPLIGVWNSFEEIEFDKLPKSFVLKCNHGSSMNLNVKDKNKLNKDLARHTFEKWMNLNYAFVSLELQYRDIPRKIIAEQYIGQDVDDLLDYKIHVFNGEPRIIVVIGNRDSSDNSTKECFLTTDWKPTNLMFHTFDMFDQIPERPKNLEEMLRIAGILGEGFRYVRVDLYNLNGQIKFGEMTFTPASGYGKWNGDEQYQVGSWIDLG